MRYKNLFECGSPLHKTIEYLNNNKITKVLVNKYTLDYLKKKGIYKIGNVLPIIDNRLKNFEVYFEREQDRIEYKEKEGK